MKTLTAAFFALIVSANLFAQEPQTADEPRKQDATVQKTQPDGLMFKNNAVWLYENGQTKAITEEIWMLNGMQITPAGTLIMANGEKAHLKEGDFVSLKGGVARPIPIGTEVAAK